MGTATITSSATDVNNDVFLAAKDLGSPHSDSDLELDVSVSDLDSLFDEDPGHGVSSSQPSPAEPMPVAYRHAPPIRGLFFDPSVQIHIEQEKALWDECKARYFHDGNTNQIMLFERSRSSSPPDIVSPSQSQSRLPTFLLDLLTTLSPLLRPVVPPDVHALLFPPDSESKLARQVILNHYRPGEGITPHVDLLKRYGDGIIGVSLGSGTVMSFAEVEEDGDEIGKARREEHLYLPERSVIVLTGDARYKWTHGIAKRTVDVVEGEEIARGERISITFRWLLPGADIVGG